jgi:hypothetical protein
MKKEILQKITLIFFAFIVGLFSCTKQEIQANNSNQLSGGKVIPNVTQCLSGYHWDYTLMKYVPNNCQPGYHWMQVRINVYLTIHLHLMVQL